MFSFVYVYVFLYFVFIFYQHYGPVHPPVNTPEYATINKSRDQKPNRILDPRMRKVSVENK